MRKQLLILISLFVFHAEAKTLLMTAKIQVQAMANACKKQKK